MVLTSYTGALCNCRIKSELFFQNVTFYNKLPRFSIFFSPGWNRLLPERRRPHGGRPASPSTYSGKTHRINPDHQSAGVTLPTAIHCCSVRYVLEGTSCDVIGSINLAIKLQIHPSIHPSILFLPF